MRRSRPRPAVWAASGGAWTTTLPSRRFVAGDRFTMGDIPVGAACYRYYQLAIERPKLAAIEAWYGRLQERAPYRTHVMLPLT